MKCGIGYSGLTGEKLLVGLLYILTRPDRGIGHYVTA
jgi:hypothetical protein